MFTARYLRQNRSVLCAALLLLLCICFAEPIRTQMQHAVERYTTVIIPSLYAMMILSQILIATNSWRSLGAVLRRISPKLFCMPDGCFALFLLSQFAGYPVGAGMLHTLHKNGVLEKTDAQRLLCVCYGCGPAFLSGLIGAAPDKHRLLLLLFFAQFLANFLLLQLLFRRHPITLPPQQSQHAQPITAAVLVQSTTQAGVSLLRLCEIILCFSAICAIFEQLRVFLLLSRLTQRLFIALPVTAILQSILEVTNAADLSLPFLFQYPVLAGLLSFGGLCVMLQVRAAAGAVFRLRLFLPCRIFAALFSAELCRLGLSLFSWDSTAVITSASTGAYRVQHSTNFPVCMLLIMIALLFYEAAKQR